MNTCFILKKEIENSFQGKSICDFDLALQHTQMNKLHQLYV